MPITFSNSATSYTLRSKSVLKSWINAVAEKEKKKIDRINYVFTSDEELLKTNIRYLKHNTYTDIITFDYSEGRQLSGDILISIDRVKDNAKKLGLPFDEELHRVMVHGILHLCGYKDKTKIDSDLMRKCENKALHLLKRLKQ